MKETGGDAPEAVQRLCGEIQLFDLCDLDVCGRKEGRFCTDQELIARFERISEDDRQPAERYQTEPLDDDEPDFDDALALDEGDDEGDGWEEE